MFQLSQRDGFQPVPTEARQDVEITRQQTDFKKIFKFDQWQGIGWTRILYYIGVGVVCLIHFFAFIFVFFGTAVQIIFGLVFVVVSWLLMIIALRVCAELMISVLLLPHLLTTPSSPTTSINNSDNSAFREESFRPSEVGFSFGLIFLLVWIGCGLPFFQISRQQH